MSRSKKKSNSRHKKKTRGSSSTTGTSKKNRRSTSNRSHSRGKVKSQGRDVQDAPPTDEPTVLLLFNKPFQVLCQFTDDDDRETLAAYIKQPRLYPAGRLDRDSEGLLLLTNNGLLQHRISHPDFKLPKTYLVQVEGELSNKAIDQLQKGVKLKDGLTAPAKATIKNEPDWLWPREPPVRFRKDIPTSWLKIELTEGRNRQVRRMTAAVGYPTLRLIRTRIGSHSVESIAPGEWVEASNSYL